MQLQKIKVDELKLSDIVNEIEHGQLRIPRFQRDFVWERSKVIKLLDSIYKEYPIGSFFIWEADKKYNLFYRNIAELNLPQPDSYTSIRYILDGQQRATSLYAAIKGLKVDSTDYSQICFDFDSEEFVVRYREHDNCASLRDILGDNKFQIYNKLTDERKRAFDKCYSIFTSYPLSVIIVREKELDEASEIFERINQGGKRLSIFDLVVASTWGEDFDLKEEYLKLYNFLVDRGFGKVPPEVVTHAASLIIKGYCRNSYQLQLTKEELLENWDEISNAIKLSVDFLTNNLGAKIYEFVPYPSIISLLAYFYFKAPGRSLTKQMTEKVHEWYWKAALSERYTSSRETKMEEDRREIFDKLLEGEDIKIGYSINLDEEKITKSKISTKSALRNAFFCMLAMRHPKHFKTNNMFALDYSLCSDFNSPEKHHIFPRHFLRKNKLDGEYSLVNFCFIPAELNKEILNQAPNDYFAKYDKENSDFKDALEAQLITYDESIKNNNYKEFLTTRSQAIFHEFERLLGSKILQVAGTNANKALDEIEMLIRTLIDKTLLGKTGKDYWSTIIPGDIKMKVQEKAKEYLRKNPSKTWLDLSTADSLSFCDIMDYSNIILKNWALFEETFRSKFEIEKRFIAFKDFRNAVKHNRDIDTVLQRDGEAALEWFSQALRSKVVPFVKTYFRMELQEKKYLIDSFTPIQELLKAKKASKVNRIVSIHYYGQHKGNYVEKFVEYSDRYEIHILKESQGRFTLTEHAKIKDKETGIAWLKKRGFENANIVKMDYKEYKYKGGTVGLYTIDDFLRSVILNYPEGKHEAIEKEFGLQNAKVIKVPYNKLLDQMNRLRSMKLE